MKNILISVLFILVLAMTGCAGTHFGVRDQALMVPPDVGQTQDVIAKAEKSTGAKYCPDNIAKAKALASEAMDVYWSCHTTRAMAMLADARKMAKEAESCQPPAPPLVAPAPTPAPVVKQPISFQTVYFDFDKSNLKPEAVAKLDQAAKRMQENPEVMLELQGNTDAIGTNAYNMALGDRRAESVFNYLKSKGITSNRMKTVSFGEEKPVATNKTKAGRAMNRRVDFVRIDLVILK